MFRQLLIAAVIGLSVANPVDKVCPNLLATISKSGTVDIAVSFTGDTEPIHNRINNARFANRGLKITSMKGRLEDLRASSQRNAISMLDSQSVKYESFWINNRIYISDATPEIVANLAALPEVAEVREQVKIQLVDPVPSSNLPVKAEWGVEKIQAPQAWNMPGGTNGSSHVVVAIIDTGARHTHEAIKNNWRSSYGWFDTQYGSTPTPRDGHGHGTHVTGTIAGADGLGVAPGASWISCKGLSDTGSGSEANMVECGQWVTCPTLPDGTEEDCSQAPDVCSNSWSGPGWNSFYDRVLSAWHTAGIVPVFTVGNQYGCRTIGSPGDRSNVIGVGSTTINDSISVFSSKGPALSADIIKPDLSAPGVDITSAGHTSDTARSTMSGANMATPHVAGAVALLKSKNPNLTYQQIKDLLQNNADRNVQFALPCGETSYDQWPNNIYGHGRINVKRALEAVQP